MPAQLLTVLNRKGSQKAQKADRNRTEASPGGIAKKKILVFFISMKVQSLDAWSEGLTNDFFYDQLIFFMGNEKMSVWHFLDHDDDNNNKHSMRAKSVILWRKENILILICQLMLIIMKSL